MALPKPPKMSAAALIPGVILLLIGIGGPALELYDRHQHPLDVHTVTVTDNHRELVGRAGTSQSRRVRMCDFKLPDGTAEDVRCSLAKDAGDTIKVYQGDNDAWKAYKSDLTWIVRGVIFTLLGAAYVWFWLWARNYHKRRREVRSR